MKTLNITLSVAVAQMAVRALEGDKSGGAALALEEVYNAITNALRREGVEAGGGHAD